MNLSALKFEGDPLADAVIADLVGSGSLNAVDQKFVPGKAFDGAVLDEAGSARASAR